MYIYTHRAWCHTRSTCKCAPDVRCFLVDFPRKEVITWSCVYVCVYIYVHICTYIYVYICTYIYVYIYIVLDIDAHTGVYNFFLKWLYLWEYNLWNTHPNPNVLYERSSLRNLVVLCHGRYAHMYKKPSTSTECAKRRMCSGDSSLSYSLSHSHTLVVFYPLIPLKT